MIERKIEMEDEKFDYDFDFFNEMELEVHSGKSTKKKPVYRKKGSKDLVLMIHNLYSKKKSEFPCITAEYFRNNRVYCDLKDNSVEVLKIDKDVYLKLFEDFLDKLNKECKANMSKELLRKEISDKEKELNKLKDIKSERYNESKKSWFNGGEESGEKV